MKYNILIATIALLEFQSIFGQSAFDHEKVEVSMEQMNHSMKTRQDVIDFRQTLDPAEKQNKFNLLIQETAGPVLSRQWSYPGGGNWPLIDWTKVNLLENLITDQRNVLVTSHAAAQSDDELARLCVVGEAIAGLGKEAGSWYEDWLTSLSKGQNTNLKRLVFLMTSKFADEFGGPGPVSEAKSVDWNKWEQAFNQSDQLGKALLLLCMTDLAIQTREYSKVAELHLVVFDGSDDDLKAVALYIGVKNLGAEVIGKWRYLADNHPNPKMKALANELLGRHSTND